MSRLVPMQADADGQVVGIPCHDGYLDQLVFGPADGEVSFVVRSVDDACHTVRLVGCRLFDASGACERNIIDRMCLWPLAGAPPTVLPTAASALKVEPSFAHQPAYAGRFLFMLESSYGVTIHALVEQIVVE